MTDPTKVERDALLDLFLDLGGPLCWTGPIPYNALAARQAPLLRSGGRRAHQRTTAVYAH